MKPANCGGLVAKTIKAANKIFIPMCKELGLSGEIGSLVYNPPPENQAEMGSQGFPIGLVVGEMANINDSDDENEEE